MIRIRLSEDAFADLEDGYWFYEVQDAGLGEYFAGTLRAEIDGLRTTAGIHRRDSHGYHRALSTVFPYAIYYTLAENVLIVWAVIDCRRDPDWIKERLDK